MTKFIVTRIWEVEALSAVDAIIKTKNWKHFDVQSEVKTKKWSNKYDKQCFTPIYKKKKIHAISDFHRLLYVVTKGVRKRKKLK